MRVVGFAPGWRLPASVAFLLAVALLPRLALAQGRTLSIDAAASRAAFSVQHIFVERVTGTIPIGRGTVTLAPGSAIPTQVAATLDPSGVLTDAPDRDNALRSADFFDVAHDPTWAFASTAIAAHGAAAFGMDGTVTIHGVTQPVHLAVTVAHRGNALVYHATGTLDRHDFGMKITRLDPVIGTQVRITLDIVVPDDGQGTC